MEAVVMVVGSVVVVVMAMGSVVVMEVVREVETRSFIKKTSVTCTVHK